MNKAHKINLGSIIVIFTLVIVLMSAFLLFDINAETAYAVESNNEYNSYTDSDKWIHKIKDNKEVATRYQEDLYHSNSDISVINDYYTLYYENADDPIINIIPKELFNKTGNHLHIGKEYGFFVKTEVDTDIFNENYKNNKRSLIMVFDITTNFDWRTTIDNLEISVTPIFQYEFVYITSKENYFIITNEDRDKVSSVRVNYNLSTDRVIPVGYLGTVNEPIIYRQINEFYLKDISIGATLSNEQAPNEYVSNSGYNVNNDDGYFFIGCDYSYEKIPKLDNKTASLAMNEVSYLFGIGSLIPGIGSLFGLAGLTTSAPSFIQNSKELLNKWDSSNTVFSSNKVTATPFYASRLHQIQQYKKLIKNANVLINTDSNKKLWYQTGSTAKATFRISSAGNKNLQTRINNRIGVKVINKNGNIQSINAFENYNIFGDPVYESLKLNNPVNAYLLPDGVNYFKFKPQYSGNYNIKLNTTDAVELYMNGVKQTLTNNACTIRLTANQEKKFEVRKKGAGCITTINITPSTTLKNLSINPNEQFIVKYHSGANGVKNLSTSNANCKISKIYTVNNGVLTAYNPGGYQFTENRNVSTRFGVGDYYIVLRNAATTAQATNLALVDAPSLGIGNSTQQLGQNLKFFKFKAPAAGNYVLTATGTNFNMGVNVVKSDLSAFNADIGSGIVRLNGLTANQVLYIGIYNGLSKDAWVNVGINKYESSYLWKVNGTVCANNTVNLERGSNYNVEFWINNNKKISDYKLIGDAKYHVSVGTGTVSLRYDSAVDGFVSLLAYLNKTNNIVYGNELRIYPKHENKIKLTGSSNGQNIINFNWQTTVSGITAIRFSVNHLKPGVSIPSSVGISGNAGSINVFYYLNLNYQMTEIKITAITINGVMRNYDSPTAKITVECWYGGGTGKSDSPYTIACARHFNNIYLTSKSGSNNFYKQTADLNFGNKPTKRKVKFYGTYDGGNKKISDIVFKCTETPAEDSIIQIGALFDDNYGIIKNISYLHADMTFKSNSWIGAHVGIVAGWNRASAQIINVKVYGAIDNMHDFVGTTGGLVGINQNKISNCSSEVSIDAYGDVGGIAGVNKAGTIDNCVYTGSINYWQAFGEMNKSAGGIAGYSIGLIKNCKGNGNINYCNTWTDRRDLRPYIAQVVGFNGSENGKTGKCVNCTGEGKIDIGNLHTVSYYQFPKKRYYSQECFAVNRIVARQL